MFPFRDRLSLVKDQKEQREQIKLDMMRSIVTEPLLSQVVKAVNEDKAPDRSFDIIIALNELFSGGVEGAMKYTKQRADEWKVRYIELTPYLFACLTADQILKLAQEARGLFKIGPGGSVVYRIWEDQQVSTTLTRSLTTVKADAAQRA